MSQYLNGQKERLKTAQGHLLRISRMSVSECDACEARIHSVALAPIRRNELLAALDRRRAEIGGASN